MFGRLSRSPIRPIQIGRKLIRAMDAGRTTGADGRSTFPNVFTVRLHENDRSMLADLEKALIAELTDAAKQYATDEGFALAGDISVSITTDGTLKPGTCTVNTDTSDNAPSLSVPMPTIAPATSTPSPTPPTIATPAIPSVPAPITTTRAPDKKAVLVLGDGTKVAVKPGVLSIGRSAESSVPLNDTNVSRRHAEIRSRGDGPRIEWYVIDVGSTNGTMLNGVKIGSEQKLKNGDSLMFGGTAARFEVS